MKHRMVKPCLALISLVLIGASVRGAPAQTYPVRAIRVVVTTTPGSGNDLLARLMAPGMAQALGQQVIVDNRPGAGSNIGTDFVAKAPADGHTTLLCAQTQTVNVSLYRSLPYDLVRDFAAVTKLASSPFVLVVHPSFPAKSISELVKLAKAKPGTIDYGAPGAGTSSFLAAELFKKQADVNLQRVQYKGGSDALKALLSREIAVFFSPLASALPMVRQGQLRALAVTSAKRLSVLSEYPTVAESGYPDYEFGQWYGLLVPAKTPQESIATLRKAAVTALNRPDTSKRLSELGITAIGDQPEEFAKTIRSEIENWRQVIRLTGMTAE